MRVGRAIAGFLSMMLVAAVWVAPSVSGDEPPSGTYEVAEPDEVSASAAAVASGQRVEVMSARSETTQLFANPDRTFSVETFLEPVRVQEPGGAWVPVDTTLRVTDAGMVAPVATSAVMEFSGGGEAAPLASIATRGGGLALRWPGRLPVPSLSGNVATYRDVLPGVDLAVRVEPTAFFPVLTVRTRQAAASARLADLRLGMQTSGLTVRSGAKGLAAADRWGRTVFDVPPQSMWQRGRAARSVPVRARVERSELVVLLDGQMLSDEDTQFPVMVSLPPPIPAGVQAWTAIYKEFPNQTYWMGANQEPDDRGPVRAGFSDWGPGPNVTVRSLFRMDVSKVAGKHVTDARFNIAENWSASCIRKDIHLYSAGAISASTTWGNYHGWGARLATQTVAHGHDTGCPADMVGFSITTMVNNAAAARAKVVTVGLVADESTNLGWKKFAANPHIAITYNSFPNTPAPTDMAVVQSGVVQPCVIGASRPFVTTTTPSLRVRGTDPDGGSVRVTFKLARTGDPTVIWSATSADGPSGSFFPRVTPVLVNGQSYSWRAQVSDGLDSSTDSGWCEFTVDTTKPTPPEVSSADYPSDGLFHGTIGQAGLFTFTTTVADVAQYCWGLDTGNTPNCVNAVPRGGPATVSITPLKHKPYILYVTTKDAAGNASDGASQYLFRVGRATDPVGSWGLDEGSGTTAADSSGNGFTGTLSGGATWALGRIDGAVAFDGTGQVVTSGPVIRTDRNFSVSAWVHVSDPNKSAVFVSQDGSVSSGLQLEYHGVLHTFRFTMLRGDNGVLSYDTVAAPMPAGEWTHLVGTYNTSTGQIQLYVNGGPTPVTASHPPAWNATGSFVVGRAKFNGAISNPVRGSVDQVRVFDRVVDVDELAELANRPPGLVASYLFDESSGTSAADSSGRGNTATIAGDMSGNPVWVSGQRGNAFATDGATRVAATAGPLVRTDHSFTIAGWVRVDAETGGNQILIGQRGTQTDGIILQAYPEWGIVQAQMPGEDRSLAPGGVAYAWMQQTGEWMHLAVVFDAPRGELRFYLNGVLEMVTEHTASWNAAGAFEVGRGEWVGGPGDWALASYDEVAVFNGTLHDEEIFQLQFGQLPQ